MNYKEYIKQIRQDSFAMSGLLSQSLGIGTEDDKLSSFDDYSFRPLLPTHARRIYANSDILQNIVDMPAEDATKEGFKLTSNQDENEASKMMMDRLTELDINKVIRQHLENINLYSRGSMVLPIVEMTTDADFTEKLSINNIERVKGLNVLPEDDFSMFVNSTDPFDKNYLQPSQIYIRGQEMHNSRFFWDVYKFFPKENIGVSLLQKIMLSCLALRVTNWSLANVMLEVQNKVLKVENLDSYSYQSATPDFKNNQNDKRGRVIDTVKRWMTSSKMMVINKNDDYTRQMYNATGQREATDFFWEYLSSVANMPQSKIKGQATGTISSADVDERRYVERVRSREQNKKIKPLLEYLIRILKQEKTGKFFKKFGLGVDNINFQIDFNPIWLPDTKEQSENRYRDSQRGQIDIATGIRSPDQVRNELYPNLIDEPLPELPEDFDVNSLFGK